MPLSVACLTWRWFREGGRHLVRTPYLGVGNRRKILVCRFFLDYDNWRAPWTIWWLDHTLFHHFFGFLVDYLLYSRVSRLVSWPLVLGFLLWSGAWWGGSIPWCFQIYLVPSLGIPSTLRFPVRCFAWGPPHCRFYIFRVWAWCSYFCWFLGHSWVLPIDPEKLSFCRMSVPSSSSCGRFDSM